MIEVVKVLEESLVATTKALEHLKIYKAQIEFQLNETTTTIELYEKNIASRQELLTILKQ